jgi:hypothetical protein
MSEQSNENVENVEPEAVEEASAPAEEAPEPVAEAAPAEDAEVIKETGDRTDASGRALYPWETSPKSK